MMKIPSIFRKTDAAKREQPPESALAIALYGRAASRPAPPVTTTLKPAPAAPAPPRAKLILALDTTASREHILPASIPLTDAVLTSMPEQLDVALAVHGGSKVQIFTNFETDIAKLRDVAAGVRCQAGRTCMLPILARALETDGVGCVVYVGDVFEESEPQARKLAIRLGARGSRLIILLDEPFASSKTGIFAEMAALSGGCVLPFDASSIPRMRDLLSAIGVLAVGGPEMLDDIDAYPSRRR